MRDGIPKTIPVPRVWQRFVECADRAADRGTQRVVDRLVDAVRQTFARYFPSALRKHLIDLVEKAESTLPGIDIAPNLPSGPNTYHLADLLYQAHSAMRESQNFSAAIVDALAAKMEADVAAHNRQILEDLAGKCRPHELRRVRAEIERATSLFDGKAEAERALRSPTGGTKLRIEPDEDIRQ
jgi:hypothetical protein